MQKQIIIIHSPLLYMSKYFEHNIANECYCLQQQYNNTFLNFIDKFQG